MTRSGHECVIRLLSISPSHELHVDRRGFRVAQALASHQELLECVREQLICCHILTTAKELASSDLVKNGCHFVIIERAIEDVAFERLDRPLEFAVITPNQSNLMAAHHCDGVGDLDSRILTLESLPGRRAKPCYGNFRSIQWNCGG